MKFNAKTIDEHLTQFKNFLLSDIASNTKSIIYLWKTERPIPRVQGESNIIYIGQTKNTFNKRYNNSKSLNIEKIYFEKYYKKLIDIYGSISVEIKPTINPKITEWEELMKYNSEHIEYPPLNRSIPNKPKP
jgi:hypothetical protein